jgi:ketosteroid isomerase-like protein
MRADEEFAKATGAKGADGWASFFADSGAMFPRNGVVAGRERIRSFMTRAFADSTHKLRWRPVSAVVARSGDLGYTVGGWESVESAGGRDSVVARGNYVTIWRTQRDGSWKVAVDIGNDGAPPGPRE